MAEIAGGTQKLPYTPEVSDSEKILNENLLWSPLILKPFQGTNK